MNRYRKLFVKIIRFVTVLSAMTALSASATENGTTAFPSGADDFLVAAMPPPGVYGILYGNRFRADQLNGNAGETLPLNFSLSVNALVPRLDWVRPVQFLGADRWGTLLILPLLDVSVALTPAPGVNIAGKKSGVGDLVIGNALHWTMGDFHMLNAVDVVVPTGRYQARDVVNLGRNQWVLRMLSLKFRQQLIHLKRLHQVGPRSHFRIVSLGSEVPVPGGGLRCEGRCAVLAGECGQVPDRPEQDRCRGRLSRWASRPVFGSDGRCRSVRRGRREPSAVEPGVLCGVQMGASARPILAQ